MCGSGNQDLEFSFSAVHTFRNEVGQPKSRAAGVMAKEMNPDFKVKSMEMSAPHLFSDIEFMFRTRYFLIWVLVSLLVRVTRL